MLGVAVALQSFPLDTLKWTGAGGEPNWHNTWPDSRAASVRTALCKHKACPEMLCLTDIAVRLGSDAGAAAVWLSGVIPASGARIRSLTRSEAV